MRHICLKVLFLWLTATVYGCMRDGERDCPIEDNLVLHFDYGDGTRSLGEEIRSVGVYLFDEDQRFYTSIQLDAKQLAAFPGAKLTVDPGTYTVVCLGNIEALTPSFYFQTLLTYGKEIGNEPFYYAPKKEATRSGQTPGVRVNDKNFTVSVTSTQVSEETIEFMQAHRTVGITVKGLLDLTPRGINTPPFIALTNLPLGYDFNLGILDNLCTYSGQSAYKVAGDDTASLVFNTPFFGVTEPTDIEIHSAVDGRVIKTINMKRILDTMGYDPGLSGPIEIHIEFNDTEVTVTIPGWDENGINPEF